MSKYAQLLEASNFEIGIIFGSFALARTIAQNPVAGAYVATVAPKGKLGSIWDSLPQV